MAAEVEREEDAAAGLIALASSRYLPGTSTEAHAHSLMQSSRAQNRRIRECYA
jgi:hypothetical protein